MEVAFLIRLYWTASPYDTFRWQGLWLHCQIFVAESVPHFWKLRTHFQVEVWHSHLKPSQILKETKFLCFDSRHNRLNLDQHKDELVQQRFMLLCVGRLCIDKWPRWQLHLSKVYTVFRSQILSRKQLPNLSTSREKLQVNWHAIRGISSSPLVFAHNYGSAFSAIQKQMSRPVSVRYFQLFIQEQYRFNDFHARSQQSLVCPAQLWHLLLWC